jgi:hypothetical protein
MDCGRNHPHLYSTEPKGPRIEGIGGFFHLQSVMKDEKISYSLRKESALPDVSMRGSIMSFLGPA